MKARLLCTLRLLSYGKLSSVRTVVPPRISFRSTSALDCEMPVKYSTHVRAIKDGIFLC
jgi:hypothetical protein